MRGHRLYLSSLDNMILVVVSVFFVFISGIVSKEESKIEIVKFREMSIIVYGTIKDKTIKQDDYLMETYMNKNNEILFATGMGISNHKFRVDEVFNDHFTTDDDIKKVFHKNLKLKIQFVLRGDIGVAQQPFVIFDGPVKIFADETYEPQGLKNDKFDAEAILIRLSCHNYTGYNCEYDLKEDDKTITDFNTGFQICKKEEGCVEDDKECAENICQNGGTCLKSNFNKMPYCACPEGFGGPQCEYNECQFDEEELLFGNKDQLCPKTPCTSTNNPCQNGGACELYGKSFIRCVCGKNYTGKFCETVCHPLCVGNNLCTLDDDNVPYCYPYAIVEKVLNGAKKAPLIMSQSEKLKILTKLGMIVAISLTLIDLFKSLVPTGHFFQKSYEYKTMDAAENDRNNDYDMLQIKLEGNFNQYRYSSEFFDSKINENSTSTKI